MGWSVDVQYPNTNHTLAGQPVDEPVASFASCPGNICTAVTEVGFPKLPHCDDAAHCEAALGELIIEIDKGNEGVFTDEWAVAADERWSKGQESRESWQGVAHAADQLPDTMSTYEKWTGHWKRQKLRQDAERFYMYYLAGCTVTFEW